MGLLVPALLHNCITHGLLQLMVLMNLRSPECEATQCTKPFKSRPPLEDTGDTGLAQTSG